MSSSNRDPIMTINERAEQWLAGGDYRNRSTEDLVRDLLAEITNLQQPAPPGEVQQPIPQPSGGAWEVVPSTEQDDWGIRRVGETEGASIAQMLWKHDAVEIVRLHNQQPSGDKECLVCGGLPPGEASGAGDLCYCRPGDDASREAAKRMSVRGPSPNSSQPSGDVSRVLAEMVEFFEAVRLNDTTRPYDHHQPRKSDGKRPRESNGGGSCFLTPREIADNALRRLAALSSSSSLPSDPEKIMVSGAETNQTDARNAQRPTAGNRGDSEQ
jgi:hypothetical protein